MSNCTGAFSSPWQYSTFWCEGDLLIGVHEDAGPADAVLLDTGATFAQDGITPNSGMILYNTTAGTYGEVTVVSDTMLTATGVTWDALDAYRIVALTGKQIALLEHQLAVVAGNIHAALAATGACDCTLADWALDYLAKLNIIEAAAFHRCPCDRKLSNEDKAAYLEWMNEQLRMIRDNEIELCAGHTAKGWPAVAWAEQGVTAFNEARIIDNAERRDS